MSVKQNKKRKSSSVDDSDKTIKHKKRIKDKENSSLVNGKTDIDTSIQNEEESANGSKSCVAINEKDNSKNEEKVQSENEEEHEENESENENEDSEPSLNMKSFRSDLSSESALKVLKKFNRAPADVVNEYLRIGGNAFEILSVIGKIDKKNTKGALVIFEALQKVLLEIIANFPHLTPNAIEACRYLMNTYMSLVQNMLSKTAIAKQKVITLKLLTAIVSTNSLLGRDILSHLSLNSEIIDILSAQIHPLNKTSVRVCFIHFLMSFLVEGDLALIRQFLSHKNILSSIFPDLVYDQAITVNLVLATIKTSVVENINISKTLKMHTFNTSVVQHLTKLYDWLGPHNFQKNKNRKKQTTIIEVSPDEKEIVLKSVHSLMIVLCTSHRFGIVFRSKLGSKSNNPLLNMILKYVTKPWENDKKSDLVIASLATCPDLYQNYITQITPYLVPRNSKAWATTMSFVCNLIQGITPDKLLKDNEHLSVKQLFYHITLIYLPAQVLKHFNKDFFETNKDEAVEYEVLKLLQIMLKQISASINYITQMRTTNFDIQSFHKHVIEYITNTFPSIESILGCWVVAFKSKIVDEEQSVELDIKKPTVDQTREVILDILITYSSCNSSAYQNISMDIDFGAILNKIENFNKDNDGKVDTICLKTLELLLQMNPNEFNLNAPLFEKTFLMLLKHFVYGYGNDFDYVKNLIIKLLISTGIFDANKSEIEVWLYSFKYIDDAHKNTLVNFFYEIISKFSQNTLKFYDKMTELKKQALMDDVDFVIAKKMAYDDIFENVGNVDDSYADMDMNNLGPVLIAAMELFRNKKYEDNSGIKTYLSFVLIYLFHNHYTYRIISQIAQICNLELFEDYFQSWTLLTNPTALKKIDHKKTLMCKISKAVLTEEPVDIFKILGLKKCGDKTENSIHVLGESVILEKEINNTELFCLLNMCIFYISKLTQISNLTETMSENIQKISMSLHDIVCQQSGKEINTVMQQSIKLLLANPVILQCFNPIPKKKNNCDILMTKFVTNLIKYLKTNYRETYINGENLYQRYLLPFRSKVIRSIKRAIDKNSVLKNDDIINILDSFNITFEESLNITSMLVEFEFTYFVSAENDASQWCKLLVFVLNKICTLSAGMDKFDKIPADICSNLTKLYLNLKTKNEVEINFDALEESIYNLLLTFYQIIPIFSKKFKHILYSSRISKSTAKLISLCLDRDWSQSSYFIKYLETAENISKKEIIFPLLKAALNHNFNDIDIFQKVYNEHKMGILKVIEKPHKAGVVYKDHYKMLCYMIKKCMDISNCTAFTNKIMKFEVSEIFHIEILHEIYMKVAQSKPKEKKYIDNYYIVFIMFLNSTLRQEHIDLDKVGFILNKIKQWTSKFNEETFNRTNVLKHASWEIFCKLALKNGLKSLKDSLPVQYNNGILVKVLAHLCKVLYQEQNDGACMIFQMAVSHSEFLNIILQTEENDTKTNLLELMWCLVEKNPSLMQSSHIPVYLGAYHASISFSDRLIIALLQLYEKSEVSLYEYRPFLWGETAINHYSLKGSVGNNLWRQPSMNEVLDLLDANMVENTLKYFPYWRSMHATEQIYFENEGETQKQTHHNENQLIEKLVDRAIVHDDQESESLSKLFQNKNSILTLTPDVRKASEIYDPAFLLPLFALLFAPEAAPATGKAAVSGVMSLIWIAMGSKQSDTRGAACLALSRVRNHIEGQRKAKDKMLWLQSIDFVRKAVSEEQDKDSDPTSAPYLSSITSLFLSRTSNVLTQPLNKLYEPLTNYIIVKDRIDLKTVPEMLLLLHSPNPEYNAHRVWMLELLRDGLKTMDDFEILINSCAYKLIMEFYTCGICDKDSKILILNIINNTIKIPKAAKILTEGHGLLPWLLGIIISLNQTDIDLVSANISLINNLRCSLVAYQIYDNLNSGDDKVIKDKNFILSDHTTTFLCSVMIMLSHKLSPRLNSKIMTKYLKTSYHITTYKKIFNANDMENLINMCDKIFRKDSECRILFQTKGKHAESLKVLIDLVLNCESDGIVDYGIKYLKLLTKKYLEQEAS